jgi:cell division protein FtsI/penicillin-binding protein 2
MRRAWFVFVFFLISCGFVILRLFYWQVVAAGDLRLEAASQYFLQFTLPATRGSILASDGSPLVMNQPAFLVYAQPRQIENVHAFVAAVAPLLDLDPKELTSQLSDPNRVWVPLAHKVETDKADTLRALELAGLGFEKEPKRYYPEASMAAHLLGFVGSDVNGEDVGYFGLEGKYERELGGKDGIIQLEKDAHGNPILIGEAKRIEPEDGRTLVLWMDRVVQEIVERHLRAGMTRYGAAEGTVIVMDPKTGGILAMATFPSYDPRSYTSYSKDLYKNPAVASAYEPGSTFKSLVMAAALEEKVVTPTTTMDEAGPVTVGEYAIRTWNNQYHGPLTMTQVLQYSSNVGMVFVSEKLGKEKIIEHIKEFGFGKPTNADIEDETSPSLRPDREWYPIDYATASFGQGIAVTPLQMVRAVSALANGGKLMEPHAVKEIRDAKGHIVPIPPKVVQEVISPTTGRLISEMLVYAVDNGEAKWAKPKGYRIAGKTGTAQIPVAGHYDDTKTIASFVGWGPADNAKFVMLVTFREPTSSPWGSETAAPLFFAIARDLFNYWGIPPQ